MTRFINSLSIGLVTLFLLSGCQKPAEESSTPVAEEEVVLVTEDAPTLEKVQAEEPPALSEIVAQPEKPASKTFTAEQLVEKLKQWDQKLATLKTSFTQTTNYDGVQITHSHGTLYYNKAKNVLRLDTLSDDDTLEQSAVTNKKEIVILDESGKKVTSLSWEEWQKGQPNQALFDFGNYTGLLNRHNVKLVQENVLALTPKENEEYTLYLTLDPKDAFPSSIKITADLMETNADLSIIQKNITLAESAFGGFFK